MRLKISDGDLVLLTFPTDTTEQMAQKMIEYIDKWSKGRGLNDVEVLACKAGTPGLQFTVLSVNDVFQDLVLDGKEVSKKDSSEAS